MKVFKVFIASPGDMRPERDIVEDVVRSGNAFCREGFNVEFEPKRWELNALPGMGNPQDAVTELVTCDIFVGMLWKRFGTPTGNKNPDTGKPFLSGTEEEFYRAWKLFQDSGRPTLLWYQKRVSATGARHADAEQLRKVGEFIARFGADGPNPGLVKPFGATDDFRRCFSRDFFEVAGRLLRGEVGRSIPLFNNEGFQYLYLPADRDARNTAKQRAIRASSSVDLLAFHGHSFLAATNGRFREDIEDLISRRKGRFRGVILNPWSECSFRKALAYDEAQRPRMFQPLESFAFDEVLHAIKASLAYDITWKNVTAGYRKLRAASQAGIEVRVTDCTFESTYMLSDMQVYFEPYQISSIEDRGNRTMNTFEVAADRTSRFGNSLADDFKYRWEHSMPLQDFLDDEKASIERFRCRFWK